MTTYILSLLLITLLAMAATCLILHETYHGNDQR